MFNGFIKNGEVPPPIRVHELKCLPQYMRNVIYGEKRFEIRINDRDYQVGDMFILREWSPEHGYTGLRYQDQIKYVLKDVPEYGLQEGYCIFGW